MQQRKSKNHPSTIFHDGVAVLEPGLIAMAEPFLGVYEYFRFIFRDLGLRYGAEEEQYPAIIKTATLKKLEYFSSFPELATFAEPRGARPKKNIDSKYTLTPAVCYHAYDLRQDTCQSRVPLVVTAEGHCFRAEGKNLSAGPERLWNFTMREVIVFGKPEHIRVFCKDMQQEIMNIAKQHGLRPRLKEAVDPFFLGESRGKMLLQKLKKLKYEIVLPIGRRSMVAVASTNDHEDFFTSRMRIHASSGDQLGSACVAFGLERWAAAFIAEHGARTSSWPYSVRKFLHQHYAVRK